MLREKAKKLEREFKKNITTAILAAFAFIIALVWRDAIQETVDKIISLLNLTESYTSIRLLWLY